MLTGPVRMSAGMQCDHTVGRQHGDKIRVAIAGLGTIGREIAARLYHGDDGLQRYELTAVSSGRADRARNFLENLGATALYVPVEQLPTEADVVIECAPASAFEQIARPAIEAGKLFITLSASSLLSHWDLVDRARQTGAAIHIPSGAIAGLDATQGLARSGIEELRVTTRKPPTSLLKAPLVRDLDIDLTQISEPVRLFDGTVSDAAVRFPESINVAVALALAGTGPERTYIDVWADPALTTNTHHIVASGKAATFEMKISNVPSENRATGLLTALSVVALLRKLAAPLRIGT